MAKPKAQPTCSITARGQDVIVVVTGSADAKRAKDVILRWWYTPVAPASKNVWRLKTAFAKDAEHNTPLHLAQVFTQHHYDVDVDMEG